MANTTRAMAGPIASSTDGRLRYYGHDLTALHSADDDDNNPPPRRLFQPRRRRPGRVLVREVPSGSLEWKRRDKKSPKYNTTESPNKSSLAFKLAVSRENAKRFLRSVIAHPTSDSTNSPNTTTNNNSEGKRRSDSPAKRQKSVDSTAGASTAAAATASSEAQPSSTTMRGNFRSSISGPTAGHPARPRLGSEAATFVPSPSLNASYLAPPPTRTQQSSAGNDSNIIPNMRLDDVKPIASGNGVSMGIHLAEPVLFLQGFESNGPDSGSSSAPGNTAMLRGGLHVRVQKSAKIKAITLRFKGKAVTRWPEGIPPRKTEFDETDTIMSHTWPFFNAQFESAERGTNADHLQLFRGGADGPGGGRLESLNANGSSYNLSSKEAKKLALSVNQSRSFGKGENPPSGPGVAAKGYRTFLPGDYIYNFELPLDSRLPETIDVELGSVKYELEAIVERSGAFRTNLSGSKEVTLIRAPAEGSLEQVEPIAISRNWEDQLHYDIVISGKSFPLGSQVPIAFKLTPLAKVQCHRIKVLITENIEYFCSNKRVHRMEPTRKLQLFEKRSDQPPSSTFPGSSMRVTSGGGIPYDQRARAAGGEDVVPNDPSNLLGSLEGESNVGPTEMEFNVQLPSCHTMKDRDRGQRLCFDTTYQNIQVHHWIKIVMRLSKPDVDNPGKRRHFEISIDSPFHILSCRATQANISLPAYSSPEGQPSTASLYECGCPGAARRRNSPTNFLPTLNALNANRTDNSSPDRSTQHQANAASSDSRQHSNSTSSQASATTLSPINTSPNNNSNSTTPVPTANGSHTTTSNNANNNANTNNNTNQSAVPSPGLARPPIAHIGGPQAMQRPIHLLRAPSFNPPAFEDQEPPPPLITPPPQYDSIASPTSGLADYFARLSDAYSYDDDDEDEDDDEGSGGDGGEGSSGTGVSARGLRRRGTGRMEVPLTPGGRVNRSMDLGRNWVPVGH